MWVIPILYFVMFIYARLCLQSQFPNLISWGQPHDYARTRHFKHMASIKEPRSQRATHGVFSADRRYYINYASLGWGIKKNNFLERTIRKDPLLPLYPLHSEEGILIVEEK